MVSLTIANALCICGNITTLVLLFMSYNSVIEPCIWLYFLYETYSRRLNILEVRQLRMDKSLMHLL
jgi:hypothetical protein